MGEHLPLIRKKRVDVNSAALVVAIAATATAVAVAAPKQRRPFHSTFFTVLSRFERVSCVFFCLYVCGYVCGCDASKPSYGFNGEWGASSPGRRVGSPQLWRHGAAAVETTARVRVRGGAPRVAVATPQPCRQHAARPTGKRMQQLVHSALHENSTGRLRW